MAFNEKVSPKAKTELFKIYVDVSTAGLAPEWELQGRGVESWTIDANQDIAKTTDVLGFVDMERGSAQPVQSGVMLKLRKGSKLAEILFDAWISNDYSKLDNLKILQKYEFVDGNDANTCKAKLEEGVMISINNFSGEAAGFLGFDIDIHYANISTMGTMPKNDNREMVFTPTNKITFQVQLAENSNKFYTVIAEEGMTWYNWIRSTYNTLGIFDTPKTSGAVSYIGNDLIWLFKATEDELIGAECENYEDNIIPSEKYTWTTNL